MTRSDLWGGSDSYERYMGRWSRAVAPLFIDWLDVEPGARWLDVGCGTGALAEVVLSAGEPSNVVGIDSSAKFVEAASARIADSRAMFVQGDALALPAADNEFDVAVSGLVLNFVPDKPAAVQEMARAVRPGGTVALYVWDYAGHMQLMRHFFDAAIALDPAARNFDDGINAPVCRPGPLLGLLTAAGLKDVQVRAIDIPTAFRDFDDYWEPFLGGTGSAPRYCSTMSEEARDRLRDAVRRRLPTGPEGEILLAARAWAAKGRVG